MPLLAFSEAESIPLEALFMAWKGGKRGVKASVWDRTNKSSASRGFDTVC